MDSYEQMRRMAEISKSLKQHGLAEDSDEAMKQAENILIDKNDPKFYVSKETMTANEEQHKKRDNTSSQREMIQLNSRIASVESQFGLLRDKINEIIAKINDLEGKVNIQPRQERQATLEAEKQQQPQQQESKNKNVTAEVKKEYTSDDVSVDKVFYAGNK